MIFTQLAIEFWSKKRKKLRDQWGVFQNVWNFLQPWHHHISSISINSHRTQQLHTHTNDNVFSFFLVHHKQL